MLPLVVIQVRSRMAVSKERGGGGNAGKSDWQPICRNNEAETSTQRVQITELLQTYYYSVTNFLFGFYTCSLLTNIIKHAAGRLRPNFIDVCQPTRCLNNGTSILLQFYVSEPECTSDDLDAIADSRRSFPSGHSSCAFYIFVFTAIYLQQTLSRSCFAKCLLLPLAQATSLLLAVLVAVSRVSDNKHHPTDVLAGATLGTLFAYFVTCHLPKMRQGLSYSVYGASKSSKRYLDDSNGLAEKISMHTIAEDDLS